MSNLNPMFQDLESQLSKVKLPAVSTPKHRTMLKKALLQRAHSQKHDFDKVLSGSTLFTYLKTMPLQKTIPTGLIAILVLIIVGQNYVAMQNTAYAQNIINQTIEKIKKEPQTPKNDELLSTIQILEEAEKNGEVEYVGEEVFPAVPQFSFPERVYEKFRLTDEDLANDILIEVNPQGGDPSNKTGLIISIDAPLGQAMEQSIDLKTDKVGNVLNLTEVQQKLQDPKLTKPWLKEVVKRNNSMWMKMWKKPFSIDPQGEGKSQAAQKRRAKEMAFQQKVAAQIEPIIVNAQVLVQGFGGGYDGVREKASYSFDFYPLTGQKNKNAQAQAEIQKAIEKLSHFSTPSAAMKIKILRKALASAHLRTYNREGSYSFPYSGAKDDEELYIDIDAHDTTENFLTVSFKSEALGVMPGKGEWLDIEMENGHIAHRPELEQKFHDPNLDDEVTRFVIKNDNHSLAESIRKYELGSERKYLNPHLSPQTAKQLADEIDDILDKADVPVIELSTAPMKNFWFTGGSSENDRFKNPNFLFSFGMYALGKEHQENPEKLLDAAIQKLKNSANTDKDAKIEFLKQIQASKNLCYDGEETLANGKKVQKLSFQDKNGKNVTILFDLVTGEYDVK